MRIVIVGGGTSGWMAAAALGRVVGPGWSVDLIESDAIGTVGVGEATIPQILLFNSVVGVDEAEFLEATRGTFKLGIEFVGWGAPNERYIHSFGLVGRSLGLIPFHHYWLQARARGDTSALVDYNLSAAAARANKFMRDDPIPQAPMGAPSYAYHFDASLYARYLRSLSEGRGVNRHEGRIVAIDRDAEHGDVASVTLDDGRTIEGDLFIDCSGFRAMLIGETMGSEFVDWSHWLPCDRAWAAPCEGVSPLTPYTRSTARQAGWQWRIPLQHRIGNGHVFSSAHMDEQQAADLLTANLDGKILAEPRLLKFKAGYRQQCWVGNVVALGLSSGFLEPLESTSIHLVQAGIRYLVDRLPNGQIAGADRASFNAQMTFDYERIRDFIILHYWANNRPEPFWIERRETPIPDTLAEKVENFRAQGRIFRFNEELFAEPGWLQVMIGQGIMPQSYHPLADAPGDDGVDQYLASIREVVAAKVSRMPDHADFVSHYAPMKELDPA